MNVITDNAYLIFVCRKASENDAEVDFLINDEKFVIHAASKANLLNLNEKQSELETKFPKSKIIITHRPLFNLIETLDQLEQLESAIVSDGGLIDSKPTGRIVDAFNWDHKHDITKQSGHC